MSRADRQPAGSGDAEIPARFSGYTRSDRPDGSIVFERPGEAWQYWPETGECDLLTFVSPGWMRDARREEQGEAPAESPAVPPPAGLSDDTSPDDEDDDEYLEWHEVSRVWLDDETVEDYGLDGNMLYTVDHETELGEDDFQRWLSSINVREDDIEWRDAGGFNIANVDEAEVVGRCRNRHKRTSANTYERPGGTRECRECRRDRRRAATAG